MVFDKGNLWKLWNLDILFKERHCLPVVALLPSLPHVDFPWFAVLHSQIRPSSFFQFGESPLEIYRFGEVSLDKMLWGFVNSQLPFSFMLASSYYFLMQASMALITSNGELDSSESGPVMDGGNFSEFTKKLARAICN
jgi:hypothetical protein